MAIRFNEDESKNSIESWDSECIKGTQEEQVRYG